MRTNWIASRSFMVIALALFSISARAEGPRPCAAPTPNETWSNASEAFSAGDLVTVASCLAPSTNADTVDTLFMLVQQMFELHSIVPADASEDELRAAEAKVQSLAERLNEIHRRQGLPTTAEEAAATTDEERERILASIDYPVMISDLILLIEAFGEDVDDASVGRASYFTLGTFGSDLSRLTIDGDEASAYADGTVRMVRVENNWYLVPPES